MSRLFHDHNGKNLVQKPGEAASQTFAYYSAGKITQNGWLLFIHTGGLILVPPDKSFHGFDPPLIRLSGV
jgi:hypothetical protein